MLRKTLPTRFFRGSSVLLSGGHSGANHTHYPSNMAHVSHDRYNRDTEFPNQPHYVAHENFSWDNYNNPIVRKLADTKIPMYDDTAVGFERVLWQEPARQWSFFNVDDTLVLEEHDREEWNEKPYVTVNHLYEPPTGCEERPMRIDANGNPGDAQIVHCFGNCAPHIPQTNYVMLMRGYRKNKCPMCQQYFYVHNRPWLVMHPDWTDEPAADEGPAYTFAEVESEFDRDFHEFCVYLCME